MICKQVASKLMAAAARGALCKTLSQSSRHGHEEHTLSSWDCNAGVPAKGPHAAAQAQGARGIPAAALLLCDSGAAIPTNLLSYFSLIVSYSKSMLSCPSRQSSTA